MSRMLIVFVVLAIVAAGNVWYRRRQASLQQVADGEVLPADLLGDADQSWVVFTTPTCATCGPVLDHLRRTDPDAHVLQVDATSRPDLVDLLEVRAAPTVLRADRSGLVDLRLAGPAAAAQFFALSTAT